MNLETLLEYLDLESPQQFVYFEDLADLIEADTEILPEAIYQLLEGVDMEVLGSLLKDYFEDMLQFIPDDAVVMHTLLDSVKMALVGMSQNIEEEKDLVLLSDELYRFRNWYSLDSTVWVRELAERKAKEISMPLRDALTLFRMESLGGEKFEYIFDEAMDFEMDQYTMSFADLVAEDIGEEEEEEPENPELEYTDQIFTPKNLH